MGEKGSREVFFKINALNTSDALNTLYALGDDPGGLTIPPGTKCHHLIDYYENMEGFHEPPSCMIT